MKTKNLMSTLHQVYQLAYHQ